MTDESAPDGKQAHEPGAKLDHGKPLVVKGFIEYFPAAIRCVSRALEAKGEHIPCIFPGMGATLTRWLKSIEYIARVSEIGANKYCWAGWREVDDAYVRYTEALGRHELKRYHDPIDADYGTLHAAHSAWNAWAILELIISGQPTGTAATASATQQVIAAMDILEDEIIRNACNEHHAIAIG